MIKIIQTCAKYLKVVEPFLCKCIQQGLEIHGLEECGPWRYTVFNWFPKTLEIHCFGLKALKMHGF